MVEFRLGFILQNQNLLLRSMDLIIFFDHILQKLIFDPLLDQFFQRLAYWPAIVRISL